MRLGICGTGRMGSSIAQRLMAVGHQIGVWNRDITKTEPLTETGAKAFASPAFETSAFRYCANVI